MSEEAIATTGEVVEEEEKDSSKIMETLAVSSLCGKEKRKLAKKLKRKQMRKEIALKRQVEEEARSKDPEEQRRLMLKEQEEAEIMERQRKEFEERERLWIEKAKKMAEEEAQRKLLEEELHQKQVENENESNEDDAWDYVEEGPAEIIWQGNEIIVKKKRVRVPKGHADQQPSNEDADRPTSNPLPPQSEAFASYKNTSVSAQQVFESVSQQTPNFGTEQDKAHCPFHIKTGACRFGSRCSRVHLYPDRSCTLLIKNMYNGPGLALEQDEGLEYTDEEIERCYEEFYEDVHTEFLKFGEIVNFKVCKNGSYHLRGNVYVHYKSLESAVLAYNSINGRYFAGKQITCEFVGVTRWKVAICGEYMKLRLKTCSRGTACNFIHCFRNPGGDYEWADFDNPPPKYWLKKMAALFGPSDESGYDQHMGQDSGQLRNSRKKTTANDGYHSRRNRSRDVECLDSGFGGDYDVNRSQWSSRSSRQVRSSSSRKKRSSLDKHKQCQENLDLENDRCDGKNLASDHGSGERDRDRHNSRSRTHSSCRRNTEDIPDNHRILKDKYSSDECERYTMKDRLLGHDSSRKYSGHHRFQSQNQSNKRERSTRQIKEAHFLDEHMKSDENYESDSPKRYDGRHNPHNPNPGPNYGEKIDECDRWETGTSFLDENERSRRNYNFDDQEQYAGRYNAHDQSSSRHHKEIRLRCHNRLNRRSHSNSREENRDSSGEEPISNGNHELYHGERRSHNHKKDKLPIKEVKKDSFSSGESKVQSNCEQEESSDKVVNPENFQQSKKHGSSSKSRVHCRKKNYENIEEDETSILGADNLKLNKASGKRLRSPSPVESSGRSRRERRYGSHEL